MKENIEEATFGAGCFWCVEAVFQQIEGVKHVKPGYSGGHIKNPAYREVCNGNTGHAEVIRIEFDPAVVKYEKLLEVFFQTHDPTTLNRQGADVGTQYRSVIFYHSDEQKAHAEAAKKAADQSGIFSDPVVTEIAPLDNFYDAESDHKDYYLNHGNQPYCQAVIRPKMEKFRAKFAEIIK
ncbi:MAG: peptide-methionine (S)-S-oxide reductase MsrA [Cryomorphaceae bacterium]|nr:peptide-methionine (S)-S-oxide reductase MsrA [Flavobacteriales bacterium]